MSLVLGLFTTVSLANAETNVQIPQEYLVQSGSQLTYFFGNGCPHCAKVAAYTDDHTFALTLDKKEVYYNRANAQEFQKAGQALGIPLDQLGVPLLIISTDKKQFLIGDEPIISYIKHYETGQKPSFWSRMRTKIQTLWHDFSFR